jgi:hypothetical protein
MNKKTALEWATIAGTTIIDPDGWRKKDGVTLDTPIDIIDFASRLSESTICPIG